MAVRIAAEGVSEKVSLESYVSMVGSAVVEVTPMYDEQFHFVLLDSPKPHSFSRTGGLKLKLDENLPVTAAVRLRARMGADGRLRLRT